jgi:hypothetical protein
MAVRLVLAAGNQPKFSSNAAAIDHHVNRLAVPLPVRHGAIGRLIGARRPTVSLALKELATQGLIARRDDGTWLLTGRPRLTAPHGRRERNLEIAADATAQAE